MDWFDWFLTLIQSIDSIETGCIHHFSFSATLHLMHHVRFFTVPKKGKLENWGRKICGRILFFFVDFLTLNFYFWNQFWRNILNTLLASVCFIDCFVCFSVLICLHLLSRENLEPVGPGATFIASSRIRWISDFDCPGFHTETIYQLIDLSWKNFKKVNWCTLRCKKLVLFWG